MRELEDDYTVDDLRRVISGLTRRISALEKAKPSGLPTAPVQTPSPGFAWHDTVGGKIQVWTGSGYNTWTKD